MPSDPIVKELHDLNRTLKEIENHFRKTTRSLEVLNQNLVLLASRLPDPTEIQPITITSTLDCIPGPSGICIVKEHDHVGEGS